MTHTTYVLFLNNEPIAATHDRGRIDRVCNRLNRLGEFLCKKSWRDSSDEFKHVCYDNDYDNFAADNLKFYRVEAVRNLRPSKWDD